MKTGNEEKCQGWIRSKNIRIPFKLLPLRIFPLYVHVFYDDARHGWDGSPATGLMSHFIVAMPWVFGMLLYARHEEVGLPWRSKLDWSGW